MLRRQWSCVGDVERLRSVLTRLPQRYAVYTYYDLRCNTILPEFVAPLRRIFRLYSHNTLIYVGQTDNLRRRTKQHLFKVFHGRSIDDNDLSDLQQYLHTMLKDQELHHTAFR